MDIKETPVGVTGSHVAFERISFDSRAIHTVAVIGCGLIGTSVALALRRCGVSVHLHDIDPAVTVAAANLGAGLPELPPEPVDLTVIAVPPGSTAAVLADSQAKGLSRIYTDVAGVKFGPAREAEQLGCDLTTYVGGHPMAGGERSGPAAATAGLFDGRAWVLTPDDRTRPDALRAVAELLARLGARPVVMTAADHDRIVARTSHVPHLISALLAARLADADESVLALCGAGIRDTTRIAAGNADLWTQILRANAHEIATVLTEIATDLRTATYALHNDPTPLTTLLIRGNMGRTALTTTPTPSPAAPDTPDSTTKPTTQPKPPVTTPATPTTATATPALAAAQSGTAATSPATTAQPKPPATTPTTPTTAAPSFAAAGPSTAATSPGTTTQPKPPTTPPTAPTTAAAAPGTAAAGTGTAATAPRTAAADLLRPLDARMSR